MEKLATEFKGRGEVSGVMFTQLDRKGDICLYKRVDPDGFTAYEVIKAVKNKAMTAVIGGVTVEYQERETYPKGDRWGATEKTTTSLEQAKKYFQEISAEAEKKIDDLAAGNVA